MTNVPETGEQYEYKARELWLEERPAKFRDWQLGIYLRHDLAAPETPQAMRRVTDEAKD